MRRKKELEDAGLFPDAEEMRLGTPGEAGRLMPVDIQQKEFRMSMRGYRESDVDEFLDQVTEELARLHEEVAQVRDENRRLRDGAGFPTTPLAGDLSEANRAADEIVRRAQEQARSLLRDAESRASAAAAGPAVAAAASGSLSPFLSKEREFLQGLATLIQQHAEFVKSTSKSVRRAPARPAPAAAEPVAEATPIVEAPAAAEALTEPEPEPESEAAPEPEASAELEAPSAAEAIAEPEPEPAAEEPEPGALAEPEEAEPGADADADADADVEAIGEPLTVSEPEAELEVQVEPGTDREPEQGSMVSPANPAGEVDLSPWRSMQTAPARRDTTSEPTAAWESPFAGRDEAASSLEEPGAVSSSLGRTAGEGEEREDDRSLRELFWGEE